LVLAGLLLAIAAPASAQPPALSSAVTRVRFPRSVECGSVFEASLTFANDGDVAWRSGEVALAAKGESDPFTLELRTSLPPGKEVLPGESHTFTLRLAAPEIAVAGAISDWRLVARDGSWFGGTASARVAVLCPARIDDAEIVSIELPAEVSCGRTYEGSVTLRNSGTTTWSDRDGYALEEVEGDEVFAPPRVALQQGVRVVPGAERSFPIAVRAPTGDGSFPMTWRMSRRGVGPFGPSLTQWVSVRCRSPGTPDQPGRPHAPAG
jgi:hypothetical protein